MPSPVPEAWDRLAQARVARLGTIDLTGVPHLVPCCFAVDGLLAYSAVDTKPKRTERLRRLANVAASPTATLLVDHYSEDWTRLWWVRAGGPSGVVRDQAEHDRAVRLLLTKYPQYLDHRLTAAVLAVELGSWRSWSAG